MTEIITQLIIGITILSFGWIQRSFIIMIVKSTIELLVRDAIDREKQQKALIYEAQTVARSGGNTSTNEKYVDAKTIPTINKIEEEIDNLKNDFVSFLPMFNQGLEAFKEEIEQLIIAGQCPEEVKDACVRYFEETKKVINGHLVEDE